MRRSKNTLCFKVFPSILFFFWCFASERFLYDRVLTNDVRASVKDKNRHRTPLRSQTPPPKGYVGYRFSSTVMLLKSGFL